MPKTESGSVKNIFLYSILGQNMLILNIEQLFLWYRQSVRHIVPLDMRVYVSYWHVMC